MTIKAVEVDDCLTILLHLVPNVSAFVPIHWRDAQTSGGVFMPHMPLKRPFGEAVVMPFPVVPSRATDQGRRGSGGFVCSGLPAGSMLLIFPARHSGCYFI